MSINIKLYHALVNKHAGIATRYHKLHDGAHGIGKLISWVYLLWLNFAYYILFLHFLGDKEDIELYEEKNLNYKGSESETFLKENKDVSIEAYVKKLSGYDVISFDVFDTLIFRPFSSPVDVFYLIGEKLGILDFKNLRMRAEWEAREECKKENGHTEVNLNQIWQKLSQETGISFYKGIWLEEETEQAVCYANPFMLEVWKQLLNLNKRIIVISDMYLSKECIEEILENSGFRGAQQLYISNEYGKNKASGTLYKVVKKDLDNKSWIHVGDNLHSDVTMARKCGIAVYPYPNVNKYNNLYRAMDMSYIIGSAYRGVVNNHIYNGLHTYGMEYEYGFIYGGLFVLGYCHFIHEYYQNNKIDKLLFLSRDGDILLQAYQYLYPEDNVEYAYWSRKAAIKLMADYDRHDYFRRFLYHKVNQGYKIKQIFHSMELENLFESEQNFTDFTLNDTLTDKNIKLVKAYIDTNWTEILKTYEPQQNAAKRYYTELLQTSRNVVAIDIGWAGSGAISLSYLVENVWKLPCKIIGLLAGTNTPYNAEPDASEAFLQSGKLTSYLFSQSHNLDLLKKHDPNKNYNIFWELLLSSPTQQFKGFYEGRIKDNQYIEKLDLTLVFGAHDYNIAGIKEIQNGIMDFVVNYCKAFKSYPYMKNISGRDAYAPMLVAASKHEKYLNEIAKKFKLEINVE